MKELLQQYAAYHLWANQLLFEAVVALPEALQEQELPGSFPSLRKTILHLWDAESIWWQRLRLQERIVKPADDFDGTLQEATQQLLALNRQWLRYVNEAQEHMLQHVFLYANSKREQFKQPTYQMLMHLFNHGTYHRGQIVNQLRQLGITKIPQTDFIVWSRKKN